MSSDGSREPDPERGGGLGPGALGVVGAIAALIFSGAVQALISAPASLVWLHPLSWVPAFWVLRRLEGRRAFLAGWLVGTSANLAIFYWIVLTIENFSNLPTWLAILVLLGYSMLWGLYCGIFAWGLPHVRRGAGAAWPLALAAWFVTCEFLFPQLFPFYQGVAWYQVTSIFLVTTVTGVAGVTFLVVQWNALALALLERWRAPEMALSWRALGIHAGVAVLLLAAALGVSALREHRIEAAEASARSFRVLLLQSNIDHLESWEMGPEEEARQYIARTRAAFAEAGLEAGGVDVVVWPEGALKAPPHYFPEVTALCRSLGVELWTGAASYDLNAAGGIEKRYNAAFRLGPDGRASAEYRKIFLLPFGEFMPFEDWLPALRAVETGRIDFGSERVVVEGGPAPFIFLICYEAIRPVFVREGLTDAVGLLVNITYDGWFGKTSNPSQHLMLSAIPAASYGLPLVRCATTGRCAVVDARGRILVATETFEPAALIREVKLVNLPTFYRRHGDVFGWCVVVAGGGVVILGLRRRRSWGRA